MNFQKFLLENTNLIHDGCYKIDFTEYEEDLTENDYRDVLNTLKENCKIIYLTHLWDEPKQLKKIKLKSQVVLQVDANYNNYHAQFEKEKTIESNHETECCQRGFLEHPMSIMQGSFPPDPFKNRKTLNIYYPRYGMVYLKKEDTDEQRAFFKRLEDLEDQKKEPIFFQFDFKNKSKLSSNQFNNNSMIAKNFPNFLADESITKDYYGLKKNKRIAFKE